MNAQRWLDAASSSPAYYYLPHPNITTNNDSYTTTTQSYTSSYTSSNSSLSSTGSTYASSVASSMSSRHASQDDSCSASQQTSRLHNDVYSGPNRASSDVTTTLPPSRPSLQVLPRFSSNGNGPWTTQTQQYVPPVATDYSNINALESTCVAPELRRNPRRTSNSAASRGCPPTLTRQAEKKGEFVEKLVDSAALIIEAIWPTSVQCREDHGSQSSGLSLRHFIQETLRRSRTSYSTLQVGLYYLLLIKPHVPSVDFTMEQTPESTAKRHLMCGRRMFLAALILSSKWLQDRNYSSRAWSRISGLKIEEINENEMAVLKAVGWCLHVTGETYHTWNNLVMNHTPSSPPPPPPSPGGSMAFFCYQRDRDDFQYLICNLNPTLDNLDDLLKTRPSKTPIYAPLTPVEPAWKSPHLHLASGSPHLPLSLPGQLSSSRSSTPSFSRGYSTPAASAASRMLMSSLSEQVAGRYPGKEAPRSLPGYGMPQMSSDWRHVNNMQPTRRSSYADSATLASSPESMVSDHSDRSTASSATSVMSVSGDSLLVKALPQQMSSKPAWTEQGFGISISPSTMEPHESLYLDKEREAAYALQGLSSYASAPNDCKRSFEMREAEAPVQSTVRNLLLRDIKPCRLRRSESSGSLRTMTTTSTTSLASMIPSPADSVVELTGNGPAEDLGHRAQKRGRYDCGSTRSQAPRWERTISDMGYMMPQIRVQ